MTIKPKLLNLPKSIFTTMSGLANQHNAINLYQRSPNFETSKVFKNLVTKTITNGHNQYAHTHGNRAIRDVISSKRNNNYQTFYRTENKITVTTETLFNVLDAFIYKNDKVIIFKPTFDGERI